MKIKFTGEIELPFADDRGSYDIWLIDTIQQVIKDGPELDDIYNNLNLQWEPVDLDATLTPYSHRNE